MAIMVSRGLPMSAGVMKKSQAQDEHQQTAPADPGQGQRQVTRPKACGPVAPRERAARRSPESMPFMTP